MNKTTATAAIVAGALSAALSIAASTQPAQAAKLKCYGVAMAGAAWLLERRVRGKPGQGAVGNRVERTVWFSAGVAIFAVFLGSAGRAIATQDGAAMDLLAPTVFAAYATGLMTTGRIVGDRLLIGAAVVAYGVAILAVLLLFTPTLYLVVAGGALVTLAAPGFVLMRREPSEIV